MLLSHGDEDGGFCEAKLCPSERHAMDGVAGAQHHGWVVLQISCKALELNATRWVKTGLSGAPLQPFERPTWMSGWAQLQGSMTPSRLLR
ncbi:hypothetical protein [Paraglaciecola chathamensis]|uniref:hypothetical protein n=1 Tax=Paraglaciecola chathamensis TaxID=368405 RepID=UPI0023542B94|nr:hypothetical protein [Paraglaciecola agarilytica]